MIYVSDMLLVLMLMLKRKKTKMLITFFCSELTANNFPLNSVVFLDEFPVLRSLGTNNSNKSQW